MRVRRAVASALGVLFAGAIVLAGIAGGRWACGAEVHDDDFNRELALAAEWFPPDDPHDPAAWVPDRVGFFRLQEADIDGTVPHLDVTLDGPSARYTRDTRSVEIRVASMDAVQYHATRRQVGAALDRRGVFARAGMSADELKRFGYAENSERGLMWWRPGWLLFFWTDDGADLETFARAYREAVSGTPDGP